MTKTPISDSFWGAVQARLAPFLDPSAWVLLLVAMVPLMFIDRPMALTLLQWTLYGLALAGVAIMIARVVFPQIDLTYWLNVIKYAHEHGSGDANVVRAAGTIIGSCLLSLGLIFLGLVLWAKT